MESWKQAFSLATFELKVSKRGFLFLFFFSSFIFTYLILSFSGYVETDSDSRGVVDVFFILMFTVAPLWARPKHFQVQQVNNELVAAPPVIMLNQLPIPADTIVKSRFIIYFIYTLPIQLLLLISFYIFTPSIQEMMSIGTYFIFAIIWLSFGVYVGCMFPASDAGDKASTFQVALYGVLIVIIAIAVFATLNVVLDQGIVHFTLILAEKWPLLSSVISLLLAITGFIYWQSYMKKKMKKLDYL